MLVRFMCACSPRRAATPLQVDRGSAPPARAATEAIFTDAHYLSSRAADTVAAHLDDRLPVWPDDAYATLYGRLNSADWVRPAAETWETLLQPDKRSSLAFGVGNPKRRLHQLLSVCRPLADGSMDTRKRAESALKVMVRERYDVVMDRLSLGPAAPLREALRTCQLSPAGDWPVSAYQLVGRNDLAEGLSSSEPLFSSGYRSVKDYIVSALASISSVFALLNNLSRLRSYRPSHASPLTSTLMKLGGR